MDLDEVVLEHELTVDLADTRLESEDGLVGRHTQVDDTVVEADILTHHGHLLTLTLGLLSGSSATTVLSVLIEHDARSILNLEGQDGD